jgi:tetratricopeptide (TPR) repeat protein
MKPEEKEYILKNRGLKTPAAIASELGMKERKVRKFLEREGGEAPLRSRTAQVRPALPKKRIWLAIAAIALAGILVYANALNGQFLLDDEQLIQQNRFIKDWKYLGQIFSTNIIQGSDRPSGFYRPLQIVTYAFDHAIGGVNVFGYHLTNVLLHIATALAIFWFLSILFRDFWLSLAAALFYVVHPLHTEAVSYIAGRADPLSAVFLFLSFVFYLKAQERSSRANFLAMAGAFVLSLLSRESALVFPLLLVVTHLVFGKKVRRSLFISVCALAAGYVVLRLTLFSSLLVEAPIATVFGQRLPGFFHALMTYVRLLVWPFNLHMEYGTKIFSFADPQALAGVLFFLASLAWAFLRRRSSPLFSFAVLWFYAALLPFSNLYPLNAYMAEHWLYLSSVGFFLLVSAGLRALARRPQLRTLGFCLGAGLFVFYSFLTVRQNMTWSDAVTFYNWTLRFAPDSSAAYNNLGRIYEKAGRREEAVRMFEKAIEVAPSRPNAYSNLAVIMAEVGRKEEAIAYFRKAAELSPKDAMLWNNLGAACHEAGRLEEAAEALQKAIAVNPDLVGAYYNLANLYNQLGRKQEAEECLRRVKEIDPNFKAQRVLGRMP